MPQTNWSCCWRFCIPSMGNQENEPQAERKDETGDSLVTEEELRKLISDAVTAAMRNRPKSLSVAVTAAMRNQENEPQAEREDETGDSFVTQEEFSKLMKKLEDEMDYRVGVYYRSLDNCWESTSVNFEGAAEEWKQCRSSDKLALKYYSEPDVRGEDTVRYFAYEFPNHRLFPRNSQSMAHLIPNDPSCSLAWLRALSIVTGIGVTEGVDSPLLDKKLRSFVEGDGEAPLEPGDVNENKNGPLKAWNWNTLLLPKGHDKHFDTISENTQLILSPIWDPAVEEWSPGTGYKLMVAASPETYKWLLGLEIITEEYEQHEWIRDATPGEPEKATKFLALTAKALADLLVKHGEDDFQRLVDEQVQKLKKSGKNYGGNEQPDTRLESIFSNVQGAIPHDLLSQRSYHTNECSSASEKEEAYRKKANDFVTKMKAINKVRTNLVRYEQKNVLIPVFKPRKKRILVIDLGKYFEKVGKEHLIPDPFLVALKAAVSWSRLQDQPLLPAFGKHPDDQSGSDESGPDEESIPFEISCTAGEDTASGDDDSLYSVSEGLTGSPGDGNCEAESTVSPSGKTSVKSSVVTP